MVYGWIWIAVFAISVILTALMKKNLFVILAFSAIPSLVMDLFEISVWAQIGTYFGVAFLITVLLVLVLRKKSGGGISDIDSIIGEKCTVSERIDNNAGCGQVSLNGQSWSARAVLDTECYEVGQTVKIVAIEGVKLICRA